MSPTKMWIDNAWVDASDGGTREVINPADGTVIARVPEATAADVSRAIAAARRAFDEGPWPRMAARERGTLLFRVAEAIRARAAELAETETRNMGKPIVEAEFDVADAAHCFEYYAGMASKIHGETLDVPDNALSMVVREPVGVVGQIIPWNYPLLMAAWKLAPALAAGCTAVLKPAEQTPLSALILAEIFQSLDLPPGVVNIVTGDGPTAGGGLVTDPRVDKVAFTGGVDTGKLVIRGAAETIKRMSIELGGKNPNIVFADAADNGGFETVVDNALTAVFLHSGQVCSAGARLIVEASVADELVAELATRAEAIRIGNGLDPSSQTGPLVSAAHRAKIEDFVASAREEGARVLAGGCRPDDRELAKGYFYRPTVLDGCHRGMRVVREETFGPLLTVERFVDESEAIALGNDTNYGLAGAVWTRDAARAHRVAAALRHGTVWINDFGPYVPGAEWGGMKRSGNGRELGPTGLHEYQEQKHIWHNTAPAPARWFT